jgi:cytochrome c oxidase subunit 2
MARSRKAASRANKAMTEQRRIVNIRAIATGAIFLLPNSAFAAAPLSFMNAEGTKNYSVVALLWGLLGVSILVVAIVSVLLLVGIIRRWREPYSDEPRDVPPFRPERGLAWIYIGSAVSLAALFLSAIWTFAVLAHIASPIGGKPALTLRVVGHQWWWEVGYESNETARNFTTANEIHIPTGKPVAVKLSTVDVIHSFWVPKLTGKMDTVPGQNNETWLEADKPGTYRGQCTEYCGLEHANMAFEVVADPPDKFAAWWENQLKGAATPAQAEAAQGQAAFMLHCAVCHAIRGTSAGGTLGPDLSHLMTRQTIASGTLPNTPGYLSGWIADPQHMKPGNLMPVLDLSGPELASIETYLETLH